MTSKATTSEVREKIKEVIWKSYAKDSASVSSICRQIAFAQGGICWALLTQRCQEQSSTQIKSVLAVIAFFFVLDAAQYLFGAVIYLVMGFYYERKNQKSKLKADQVTRHAWMNFPSRTLWFIKVFVIGYASFLTIQILLTS